MEAAKKLVLIDPRILDKISSAKDRAMYSMENDMNNILHDSKIPDDRKAKLYSSAQTRYLTVDAPDPVQKPSPPKQITDAALTTIPKKLQPKAKRLLDFIKKKTDLLINDNGEIVYNGETVPDTNAGKLIDDLLRKRKNVSPGWDTFIGALKEARVPKEFLNTPAKKKPSSVGKLRSTALGNPLARAVAENLPGKRRRTARVPWEPY